MTPLFLTYDELEHTVDLTLPKLPACLPSSRFLISTTQYILWKSGHRGSLPSFRGDVHGERGAVITSSAVNNVCDFHFGETVGVPNKCQDPFSVIS